MIPLDTIVATATPHGFGGVSVVRMSGPDSKNIIRSISLSSKNKEPFKHKTVVLVRLIDENNVPFEDGVVTFFKKPNSYTGEDVVEISCHGNHSIVNKLIFLLTPSAYLISQSTSCLGFTPFSISMMVISSEPLMFNFFLSNPSLN